MLKHLQAAGKQILSFLAADLTAPCKAVSSAAMEQGQAGTNAQAVKIVAAAIAPLLEQAAALEKAVVLIVMNIAVDVLAVMLLEKVGLAERLWYHRS